jgi:hypothetical protein
MRDDRLRAASADRGAKGPQIVAPGDPAGRASLLNEVNASLQNYVDSFGNPALRADGKAAWRLARPPAHRGTRRAWLDAGDLAEERRIAGELQMQVWQDLPFIPMGEYWQTTAYRKNLTGIIPGCFTVFYNVKRA